MAEQLGRAYAYWAPHPWIALTGEYLYEQLEKSSLIFDFHELRTQRIPIGASFFHPAA